MNLCAEVLAGSRTSFHEAGHAVICKALGYRVKDINFRGDPGDPVAYVYHDRATSAFDGAVIGLAGAGAVMIKFGESYGALSGPDKATTENLSADEVRAACERSLTLLQEHWAEVEKLAYELYPAKPEELGVPTNGRLDNR